MWNFLRIFLGYYFPIALETLIFVFAHDIIDLFRPSLLVIFTGCSPLGLCKWTKCLPYSCHHWWPVGAAVRTVCDVKWIPVWCSLSGTLDYSFSYFPATGSSSRCEIMVLSLRANVAHSVQSKYLSLNVLFSKLCFVLLTYAPHTPATLSSPEARAGYPNKNSSN